MNLQDQLRLSFKANIESSIEDLKRNHKMTLNDDQKDIFRYAYLMGFEKCMDMFKGYIKEGLSC